MKTTNEILEEIISKKEDIARLISLAYAGGDKEKAQKHYEIVHPRIMESYPFIFKEPPMTKYQKELNDLYKSITKQLGYEFRKQFFEKTKKYDFDPFEADTTGIDKETEKKLKTMYSYVAKVCLKGDITYQDYINMYKENGKTYIKDLTKKFLNLQEKLKFQGIKKEISYYKYSKNIKNLTADLTDIIRTYKIQSTEDLMQMYTEASSVLVNAENLTEEEKIYHKNSIEKFASRPNVTKNIKNESDMEKFLKTLEKIYSNEFMRNCLESSNLEEFLKRYSFSFTANNFKKTINAYLYIMSCQGYVCDAYMEQREFTPVFFKEQLFKENTNKNANHIILHEFIHTTEKRQNKGGLSLSFVDKYWTLNEALTDCLTVDALSYMQDNLINIENEQYKGKSKYRHMIPMVNMLKETSFWETLLLASKIENDAHIIERKIGLLNTKKIGRIFTKSYNKIKRMDLSLEEEEEELRKVIRSIKKEIIK